MRHAKQLLQLFSVSESKISFAYGDKVITRIVGIY